MKKKGFTLVELLAVIAILAILVIMALPAVLRMFEQARMDSFNNELNTIIRTARQQYLLDGGVPKSWSNVEGSTSKLNLSGSSDLHYYVEMDGNGKVVKLLAENGTYQCRKTGTIDTIVSSDIETISNLSASDTIYVTANGVDEYTCEAKKYLAAGTRECAPCLAGSYCPGGTYAFNASTDSGKEDCPAGMTSSANSSDKTACYINCTAGKYLAAGTTLCSVCPAGKYCTGGKAYYSDTQNHGLSNCPTSMNSDSNAKAVTECYVNCTAGTYLPQSGNTCQTCPNGFYCPAGKRYAHDGVSTASNSGRTQCPDGTSSSTGSSSSSQCTSSLTNYGTYNNASKRITSSGTITFTSATNVDIYMVGGGGGGASSGMINSAIGGSYNGGGGGGGGAILFISNYTTQGTYTIYIGRGGNGGSSAAAEYGVDGGNTIIKLGTTTIASVSGGSGGKFSDGTNSGAGGSTKSGTVSGTLTNGARGGNGGTATSTYNGNHYWGENGIRGTTISGFGIFGAGGGGGSHSWSNGSATASVGGAGGGGAGAVSRGLTGYANSVGNKGHGTASTGSGGGGGAGGGCPSGICGAGGSGGSGIVIIKPHTN